MCVRAYAFDYTHSSLSLQIGHDSTVELSFGTAMIGGVLRLIYRSALKLEENCNTVDSSFSFRAFTDLLALPIEIVCTRHLHVAIVKTTAVK